MLPKLYLHFVKLLAPVEHCAVTGFQVPLMQWSDMEATYYESPCQSFQRAWALKLKQDREQRRRNMIGYGCWVRGCNELCVVFFF